MSPKRLIFLILALRLGAAYPACEENAVGVDIRGIQSLPSVAISVNAVNLSAVLDSGATTTALLASSDIGRAVRSDKPDGRNHGLTGVVAAYGPTGADIHIGRFATMGSAQVIDATFTNPNVGAILGNDALPGRWRLDLAKRVLATPIGNCVPEDDPAYALKFRSALERATTGRIVVTVKIDGVRMRALLDTGSNHTTIFKSAAKRVGFHEQDGTVPALAFSRGIDGTTKRAWNGQFDFDFAGEAWEGIVLRVIDDSPKKSVDDIQVLIGNDWLLAHAIAIDRDAKTMSFAPAVFPPFRHGNDELEHWLEYEANNGNMHAQYDVAVSLIKKGNKAEGQAWLNKSAGRGSPEANYLLGRQATLGGRYTDAIGHLHAALSAQPDHMWAAIWLYLAQQRQGNPAEAARDIAAAVSLPTRIWPRPVIEFMAGSLTPEQLLSRAPTDRTLRCDAYMYITESLAAKHMVADAAAWRNKGRAECS